MAIKNVVTSTVKCLTLPAAIITGIQAAIWFGLSLAAIFCYNNIIGLSSSLSNTSYGYIIYKYYLQPVDIIAKKYYVHPNTLNIFMYVYLVISFIWLVISITLAWVTIRKKWDMVSKVLIYWSIITITVAILDITLMSLLASDIQKARSHGESVLGSQYLQAEYTAIGIIMSVAARGYILWILNVVCAIVLIVSVCRQKNRPRQSMLSPIDAYQSGSTAFSLYDNLEIDNSFQNRAFEPDDTIFGSRLNEPKRSNGMNPLSNSAQNPLHPFEFGRPTETPPAQNGSRVAKIGKAQAPGRRSPPRRVPSPTVPALINMYTNGIPYIPEPDYTPPSSPKMMPKSVLRPKTKYEL